MKAWLALAFGMSFTAVLAGCAVKHKRGADVDEVIAVYAQSSQPNEICYRSALKEDASLEGQVTLEWTVNDRGEVTASEIKRSDLPNANFEKCLLKHLQGLKFQPTRKFSKATVEYELTFRRGSTKE